MDPEIASSQRTFTALVLAGDRRPDDAVARAAGVCCKALTPVAGRPMVLRVLDALGDSDHVSARLLCGPPRYGMQQCPELQAGLDRGDWSWVENQATPSSSAHFALQTLPPSAPVLLTTADHALLRSEIVDYFCAKVTHSGYDLAVALALYDQVMAANPGVKRTGLRFRDHTYCGCNLFAITSPEARKIADFWRRVEQDRKRPWRVMKALGWSSVLRYLLRRLTLDEALERLSKQLGINIGYIILPFPQAAVDVDTESDWRYVQQLLDREGKDASTRKPGG
jgi:GTP:adenosylcobinamide-phosphate guanylyltransferase